MSTGTLLFCLDTDSWARGLCFCYKRTKKWTSSVVRLIFHSSLLTVSASSVLLPEGETYWWFENCCKELHLPERVLQDSSVTHREFGWSGELGGCPWCWPRVSDSETLMTGEQPLPRLRIFPPLSPASVKILQSLCSHWENRHLTSAFWFTWRSLLHCC